MVVFLLLESLIGFSKVLLNIPGHIKTALIFIALSASLPTHAEKELYQNNQNTSQLLSNPYLGKGLYICTSMYVYKYIMSIQCEKSNQYKKVKIL